MAGVKEYYILDPSGEQMRFYRLTPDRRYEQISPDAETVVHSELLPGFQFRMEDLERQPDLVELGAGRGVFRVCDPRLSGRCRQGRI